jgi:bifunctional non-homologous end joining protein LigD
VIDARGEALGRAEVVAGGRTLALSNAEKVLFPAAGFTKRDLVDYYLAVAPAILPHLAGRAVTLARFPDGVDAPGWYQTNCPSGRPPWVGIAELRGGRGQVLRYCRLENPAALAWAASMAAIELHPLLSSVDRDDAPAALVLDLDPRPPAGLADCARVALRIRELLAARRLEGRPKASGGAGLHVHVPLDGSAGFDAVNAFARAVARLLAARDPARVTDRMPLAGRAGKVLVDWRQNSPGRSLIAPWSLRAARLPLVAAPLRWGELEEVAESGDEDRLRIGPAEAIARLRCDGDPFASAAGQRLPSL